MSIYATQSPALVAMQALHKALITDKKPGSPWSKTRVPHRGPANDALTRLLRDLIHQGAHFDTGDIAEIDRTCGAYSTTGKFDTDIHGAALAVGNASAADSWEHAKGWPGPWAWPGEHVASVVHRDGHGRVKGYERGPALLKRLGSTSAILLDGKWWRVYQIGAEELRLSQTPGDDGITLPETRKGILRFVHTRETWAVVVKVQRKAAKEATGCAPPRPWRLTARRCTCKRWTCADDGDRARRAGDHEGARAHYARGLALEREAALAELSQPLRGVLFKSAAWLAMNADMRDEALRLARLGLSEDDVPDGARAMLQEVADAAVKVLGRKGAAEELARFVEAHPGEWRAACMSPSYPCTEPGCGQNGQVAKLYLPGSRRVRLTPNAEGIVVEWRDEASRWVRPPSDDADAPLLTRVVWAVTVALHAEGVEIEAVQAASTDQESVPLWLVEAITTPEVKP